MRRTNRIGRKWQRICRFCSQNHRLLCYILLLAAGVWGGSCVRLAVLQSVVSIETIEPVAVSLQEGASQVMASCFLPAVLLLLLFLSGLSAWAAPVTAIVPFFYGLGLGMTQAYCATQMASGVWVSLVWIWPHSLIEMAALLMGCGETLQLSLRIAAQLLPGGTIGSLWRDFRLYIGRFLWFLLMAFIAAVIDVLLRMFIPMTTI